VIEPVFLSVADVRSLHADQLERYGGLPGVRDEGALQAAVEMARATYDGEYLHAGLFSMAATYAFHIAESQAFVDGNKRTGLNAALVFLLINGWQVSDPHGRLYDAMIAIAMHTLDKAGLAQLLEELASPDDDSAENDEASEAF
jgi:death-on-curing protein